MQIQIIIIELQLQKTVQIPASMHPEDVNFSYFKFRLFDLSIEFIVWNIWVYDTGLQRYRDKKISVCGKDSISLENNNMWSFLLK